MGTRALVAALGASLALNAAVLWQGGVHPAHSQKLNVRDLEIVEFAFEASTIARFLYEDTEEEKAGEEEEEGDALNEKIEKYALSSKTVLDVFDFPISESEKDALQLDVSVEMLADTLKEQGMALMQNIFDPEDMKTLLKLSNKDIHEPTADYGEIVHNEYRKDLPLPLEGEYLLILQRMLSLLLPALEKVAGKDLKLMEFAAMHTYPGAKTQNFHSDSSFGPDDIGRYRLLYTVFLYLDDIGPNQAPLDAVPKTHTNFMYLEDKIGMDFGFHYIRLAVPAGSMVIYDSCLQHRGSGNTSPLVRPTIYFSVMEANETKEDPDGPTYSIRPEYEGLSVSDVVSGRIPPTKDWKNIHDDQVCLKSMKEKCPEYPDGVQLFGCALKRGVHKKKESKCGLESRMQKLANAFIFAPNYPKLHASWGPLSS